MSKSGRPLKLTPAIQTRIVQSVRNGNYPETAARIAGIPSTTFYRWMRVGKRARSGTFWQFWQAIKKAVADSEEQSFSRHSQSRPEKLDGLGMVPRAPVCHTLEQTRALGNRHDQGRD
jgi:hypothetical protein